jgi:hypothetical protein
MYRDDNDDRSVWGEVVVITCLATAVLCLMLGWFK